MTDSLWFYDGNYEGVRLQIFLRGGLDLFERDGFKLRVVQFRAPVAEAVKLVERGQRREAAEVLPCEHNPGIPAALEPLILKCLVRDPEKRYPFMGILTSDVQKALYV